MGLLLCAFALLVASCDSETDEPSPGPTESSRTRVAVGDLSGVWTGDVFEPGRTATWKTRLTIEDCGDVGARCGTLEYGTSDYGSLDETHTCSLSVIHTGYEEDLDAAVPPFPGGFTFIARVQSGICVNGLLVVTPMQDGATVGYQEYWEGGWGVYGVLRLEGAPPIVWS